MDADNNTVPKVVTAEDDDSFDSFNVLPADEPEGQMHMAMVIVGILAVAGFVGNALVLYVFSGQRQKPTATIFILTLACTDFITSTVTMPYTIVVEMLHFKVEYDFVCKLYQFLITSTIPFSAFVMVAIAVDRYLCIVHPFKHTMTMDRAKTVVCILAVLATLLGLLCCLMYGVYDMTNTMNQVNCTSSNMSYNILSEENTNDYAQVADRVECNTTDANVIHEIVNTGFCHKDLMIFDRRFFEIYQKVYSACFGVCAVIVIVLYAIIYHSVLTRRRKRLHASNKCCCLWQNASPCSKQHEHTEFVVLKPDNYDADMVIANGNTPKYKDQSIQTDKSVIGNTNLVEDKGNNTQNIALLHPRPKPERLRMANIKTALMLSVVALTYIIAFLPAWLMALRVVPMNVIIFYLYFSYNVANPIIYAFLNQSFRNHLKTLIYTRQKSCTSDISRVTWESALQSSFRT